MKAIRILYPMGAHQGTKFSNLISRLLLHTHYSTKSTKPMSVPPKPLQLGEAKKLIVMMAQRFKIGKLQALRKQQQELEMKPKLHVLNKYEKLIGLKEVQVAQMAVRQQEKMLMETIQERQTVIEKLLETQRRIKVKGLDNVL